MASLKGTFPFPSEDMKIYNDREFPGILRYQDQFFSDTGTGTFFRDQFFPVPVPVLFSGTKFFRNRYRYFFPGPILSGTDTGTIQKGAKFPGPGCHTLLPRKLKVGQNCHIMETPTSNLVRVKICSSFLIFSSW